MQHCSGTSSPTGETTGAMHTSAVILKGLRCCDAPMASGWATPVALRGLQIYLADALADALAIRRMRSLPLFMVPFNAGASTPTRAQWAHREIGLYMPGRYHHLLLLPTLPGACSIGSSGSTVRCAAIKFGVAELVWSWYIVWVK